MSYIWDGVTIVIILSFMLSAFRKGFLNTIIRFVGLIGALIASGIYSQPVAKSIYTGYFKAGVVKNISLSLEKMGEQGMEEFSYAIKAGIEELPSIVKAYVAPGAEEYLETWFSRLQSLGTDGFAEAFSQGIVEPIMVMVLRALVFSAFFVVLMFFVNMVASLFKGIKFIPLIGSLNSVLGAGLGALQGILYVFVLCTIMWLIVTATGGIENILTTEIIENTVLLKRFFLVGPWFDGVLLQYNFSLS